MSQALVVPAQEEQLLQAMDVSFRKLQTLHRARLDKAKSRTAVVEKMEEDFGGRVTEVGTGSARPRTR